MADLFDEKLALLSEVYTLTKDAVFTGGEADAQTYIDLYTKREELFQQLSVIDKKLALSDCARGKDADAAQMRIKDIASLIYTLDKQIEPFAKKAMDVLKGNIKDVNVGKSLSSGYKLYMPDNAGVYFDTKN